MSAPPQAAAHSAGDGRSSDRPALLEASGVTVRYPGVLALSDVGLAVRAGEVRALLGENGAGKSTLIKVIGGLERPSAGSVRVDGREVRLHTSNQAQAAGISVVSQEFRLVPQLTVAENIFRATSCAAAASSTVAPSALAAPICWSSWTLTSRRLGASTR